jgi:mono/diheme cytochrome c family protein
MNVAILLAALAINSSDASEPDYLRDIKPLFRTKCYACHGAIRQKSGLRLDAGQLILKGNKRGPVIVPGNPEESSLLDAVSGKGERMPPEGQGEALTEKEIALLTNWIKQGAKAPEEPIPDDPKKHWAYQVPQKAEIPTKGNPIDVLLSQEREKHKLSTTPEADKPTLLRRVYLDLVGIPPTSNQLHAFLKDTSEDAYEKVVAELLKSSLYGERWGRHWMDIWRYSDPFGLGEEYRYSQRHIWRWRDWIIESLNQDKGYDRMIQEMLAGDEIAPADRDTLRATGYLARNWYKFNRNVWVQDTVEYTASGFLGVTLRCARCHDHKYDPISQMDYYQFRAFFEPHEVRIDPMPGQPDPNKDGVARAYDGKADVPTYLFIRGDERTPDKSKLLSPTTLTVLGNSPSIQAVKFSPKDFASRIPEVIEQARKDSQKEIETAETVKKRASEAVTSANQRLQDIVSGWKPKDPEWKPILHDLFPQKDDNLWKIVSGQWVWDKGKLICKVPSPFATISGKINYPTSLMGRIKYKTTGGGIASVGFSYDVVGNSFQAVYINASKDSAVRPFHRVNGQDTYPSEGIVPISVKLHEEVILDFAVRGDLLNVWINGKLTSVYKLPIARQNGTFTLWTHDATAEFSEVKLYQLPDSISLSEKRDQDKPSPLSGPIIVTKADAEKIVQQAESVLKLAETRLKIAQENRKAIEARYAVDQARLADGVEEAKWKPLAILASQVERQVALLKTQEAILVLEQSNPIDQKKLEAAKKAHTNALSTAAKEDSNYTPLVKVDPMVSSGRRLALAKWITDKQNPLTARVAVNHIWMRHFGTPLVPTVANFGLNGKKPTHPELLDYLAIEFMDSGWSMKKFHRLIVTSKAYRLSSANGDGPNKKIDPENRYYWRANSRRMEAEVVRDSLLSVANQLDKSMGGPIIDEKLGLTSKRRSVYFRFNTEYKMQFLDQFDAASPTECYERRESVIPQQALALHNSVLALNMSRELAKNIAKQFPEPAAFVTTSFENVLGRLPTKNESNRCETFLKDQAELYRHPEKLNPFPSGPSGVTPASSDPIQHAREDLIHVLFNHNDFVTIR